MPPMHGGVNVEVEEEGSEMSKVSAKHETTARVKGPASAS
jgi:hypothetical protein